jgi:hypothetical protein
MAAGVKVRRRAGENWAMLHPKSIAHHRNGVCGVPFHVCLFKDGKDLMLGIKFDSDNTRDIYTAVFNVAKLAAGDIEFASNSYRGDVFDGAIKGWIKAYNDEWDRKATEGAAELVALKMVYDETVKAA